MAKLLTRLHLLYLKCMGKLLNGYIAKLLFVLLFFFLLLVTCYLLPVTVDADELEEIAKQIADLERARQMSIEATQPLEAELEKKEAELLKIQNSLDKAALEIKNLEESIKNREKDFATHYALLASRVESYYKSLRRPSEFILVLFQKDQGEWLKDLSYRQAATDEDKKIISRISQELLDLEHDKKKVEEDSQRLAILQAKLDKEAGFLGSEIKGAKEYQEELSGKIAELTARQQQILAARTGTFTSSVGEVPVSNIPCSGPPGSPSFCDPGGGTWFGGFSFGAWTHRKGLSQYGAKGRADAGRNFEEILEHYYGKRPVDKDTGGTIAVDGFGDLDFENYYLYGIAEMPSSWHKEALKAQAVAARTFALRYKTEGRAICTTQSCQVFSQSKANNPPAAWREAVEETRGKVIDGVTGFYSSTAGGYLTTSGWDTTDGQGGPGFATRAWESKAGSPWFYSSWFTESYHADSSKCGRSHSWLKEEEMTDILNAWLVLKRQGSDERILPVTIKECPIGGNTGDPYSISELKDKANSLGGAFASVTSASVVYGNNGETNSLTFTTNKGEVSLSGSEFKQAFNLRAPGHIALRSPLFNIEKK